MVNIELVVLSFMASLGFGIVFQIKKEDLFYAGFGGAITRIVYLVLMNITDYRIVYAAGAAFIAAVYSEILAYKKKMPATLFLYPTIIPLIPGDLLYYSLGGIVLGKNQLISYNGVECICSLIGISLGFVICSTILYFMRNHNVIRSN